MKHSAAVVHLVAGLVLALTAQPLGAAMDPGAALQQFLEQHTTGLEGRVEIEVGQLDPRVRPAPCASVVPFVPGGVRLWGRASIGLRCADGQAWSTFLPVQIRVHVPVLVAARPLPAGQPILEGDFTLQEVDLTRQPPGLLRDAAMTTGKVLSRPMMAGQTLQTHYLRAQPVVHSGDPVRLVYSGPGFSVSTDARALGSATEGQLVRVQTSSGRVLSGVARPGRLVEMKRP